MHGKCSMHDLGRQIHVLPENGRLWSQQLQNGFDLGIMLSEPWTVCSCQRMPCAVAVPLLLFANPGTPQLG